MTQRMRVLALKKKLERKHGCKLNPPISCEELQNLDPVPTSKCPVKRKDVPTDPTHPFLEEKEAVDRNHQ